MLNDTDWNNLFSYKKTSLCYSIVNKNTYIIIFPNFIYLLHNQTKNKIFIQGI